MTQSAPTPPPPVFLLTTAERDALRHGLTDRHLLDLPLLDAALQQGDQLLPFLREIADLLRAGASETALVQLDATLAPILALDANAEALATTLTRVTTAWETLLTMCPAGTMPVAVLTDPAAVRMVAEAAEAVSEHAQELALRTADRARLLDQRLLR